MIRCHVNNMGASHDNDIEPTYEDVQMVDISLLGETIVNMTYEMLTCNC